MPKSRYSVIDRKGTVYSESGMLLTLKDNFAVEKPRKRRKKRDAGLWFALTPILIGFLAVFFVRVQTTQLNKEMPKPTTQTEPQTEIVEVVPEEVEEVPEVSPEAPAVPEVDYYIESISLSEEKQKMLYDAAQEFGIPYELAVAVVWRESDFENIYGDGGKAYGYFQIWPKWHTERANRLGVYDLMDTEGNFRVGCSLLADYIKSCDGDIHKALMVYNMGAGGASKLWRQGITTSKYSRAIVAYMEGLI